ncbi:MAG: hypothetical protein JHC33_07730 [Ignisphaera sp.]|nr:hypothetical protein [Ignisphaera sp.]
MEKPYSYREWEENSEDYSIPEYGFEKPIKSGSEKILEKISADMAYVDYIRALDEYNALGDHLDTLYSLYLYKCNAFDIDALPKDPYNG